MRQFSKKLVSIFLSVVLVLGIFSVILPTAKLIQNAKAETALTEYVYNNGLLDGKGDGMSVNDTRIWDFADGIKHLGIWNAMGLNVTHEALGISQNFFDGTEVGAERNEIHPYIVYNVTPGTSFKLYSAIHKDCKEEESVLNFYVSNDGVTWVPMDVEKEVTGLWEQEGTYDSFTTGYVYTIDNVGSKTNFVKAEYPMTMDSSNGNHLLVYKVAFVPVDEYAVNGQTLFEAKTFGAQKELYEEYFIAYPDFVHNGSENAATSNYSVLANSTWGDFVEKDRSYIAMVAPGSHFYLETANNWYMKTLGEALAAKNKLESADKARIRVYSSASLSDDAAWTEHDPMPFSFGGNHTPTFNFYLPEDHIYVRIVYPQEGNIATVTKDDGSPVVDTVGNDAAFFNDMVFTPYVKAEADYTYDHTTTSDCQGTHSTSENLNDDNLGLTVTPVWNTDTLNFPNGHEYNKGAAPYEVGYYSATYAVEGGKMFNLEYAVRLGNYRDNNWRSNHKATYEDEVIDGSSMEMIIQSSTDGVTWSNSYETESGYAETTSDGDRRIFDVSYLVPEGAQYVRVSFGIRGMGFLHDYTGDKSNGGSVLWFNDCLYLRKVSVANANNVYTAPEASSGPVEYIYTTDTDTTKVKETGPNTPTGEIDGAVGFSGDWTYLAGGDGNNPKTLAGILERPYVIYDVIPGSNFSFDYAMRATAKAASETTAALNIKGGLGSEALREYEFFVYGRKDENSDWTPIGKTDSGELDYRGGDSTSYNTFGYNNSSFPVPANVNQIKVELPQTGGINTGTPVTYDYSTLAAGDYWNADDKKAPLGVDTICDYMITKDGNLGGLAPGWSLLDCAWGTKEFYLIYKVKAGTTFVANFTMPDAATRANYATLTGETSFEAKLEYSADKSNWSEAVTTADQGTDGVLACTVPGTGDHYVKITFPQKGKISDSIRGHDTVILTGVSFYTGGWVTAGNDAAYLYNVKYATGIVVDPNAYIYTTDTDTTKVKETGPNTPTGEIDGAVGFSGDWTYLAGGDGNNPKTLAGILERPYVIYDVIPGSNFSFDYAMRATAKAASETTAALNIKGGLGSEALREYEFFVYGRKDENSDWTPIGKTDSGELDYRGGDSTSYNTFGYNNSSFPVPANVNQIKVELPQTGGINTGTPVTYDYSTLAAGDYWNADDKKAPLGVDTICDYMITKDGNLGGLAPGWSLLDCAWGTKEFYLIYKVKAGTTFVANFTMPDAATRANYATLTGETSFEAKLEYSADKSNWSEAVTTADQGTDGVLACTVPGTGDHYVKITFPQKGKISDSIRGHDTVILTGVSFYTGGWVTAGNDAAYLYNVKYATGKKPGSSVDYTELGDAGITNDNKYTVNAYNFGEVSIVNGEGVKANSDEAFVTYKIKEDTMLTLNTTFDLSFEYSVDDSDYKPFTAVKTCYGYVIPAIAGRNYIKVNLKNGQSITKADAEILGPTARFYIRYLDKYELKDYADYGVAANSVAPNISTLRPGYKFIEWDGYNSELVYTDTTFEATFDKDTDGDYTYTISYTVNTTNGEDTDGMTTTKQNLHFDDAVTITAPATNDAGQEFSKWVDDKGVTVSYKQSFTILANGDLSLRAVYASDKANIGAHIYATDEPIIKNNDNGTWNMSVVWRIEITEDVKLVETGILYGRDVEQANLILLGDKAQAGTAKVKHSNTDANRTAMYTVKNIASGETRTALPYAILSNGDVIYGERAIKVKGGALVESSTFEFNKDGISVTVLNKYLDRTVSYDAFGSINDQSQPEAVADARDFVRRTGAKYLARATGAWVPTKTDIYGDNFTNYTKWASEIHEADPDVILEACIFETVTAATDGLAIPRWVQEAFGLTYNPDLTFDHTEMMHDATYTDYSNIFNPTQKTYGENHWDEGIHIPSISKVQTQMYIYYRACTYIDMGFEAIHLGQMYRIGAEEVNSAEDVETVDYENWELVLNKITEYAKTNARRGYVLFNGHTEDFPFVNADGSQMLDFNLSPVRIQADATTGTEKVATSSSLQPVRLSKSSDGENVPYLDVTTNVKTRSGETCDYFPYLLEFDNFGHDASYKDTARSASQYDYVWGYDEISWYANQDPTLRAAYLSTLNDYIKGLEDAPNGHVAMPGRRTAYISDTGCSEYKEFAWVQALMDDNGIAKVSLWEVSETDIAGIIDAWN